ncbi:tumor necrosis factor ligand superfamily member 4 isoform X1 [Macaca nemestrina]|uniref:Tumor necrosis factor ligand superfamily member 4 n=1 Tax=Piliocolobus tephrosceles TaxID=591936 RepID=A0A8C9GYI8_9PRIM|nr:tumor necrosis factor ligand superfamily member 4 isoform X1 [Macaca nemestrina]XP_050623929.1 tumor necrosis factor ligand superfamily member 4 isoform X1 [Macaca thibetana thibetana]
MPKTSTGCPRHRPELGSFEKKTKRVTKYRTAECIHQSGSPKSAFSNNHSVTYFLTPWDDKTQDTWLHSRLTDCTRALSRREQKVSHQYPRIQSIKVQFTEYKKEEGFILTSQKEDEIMKVQNNSVIINCDGFYLISLKGYFSQEVNISLHYQKDEEPLFQLKKVRSVNSLMVASLTYKDKVYLNVTTDNTSLDDFHVNGGELILIHQNPGEFCVL